jgi:glycosyltransferase involved in cell wall biosynthesis
MVDLTDDGVRAMLAGSRRDGRSGGHMQQPASNDSPSAPAPTPRLSVVVMAFNEAASVASVVHELDDELRRLGENYEILLIDDGSSDGTGAIADGLTAALPALRVHHHGDNRGLGGVYRTGFAEVRGELVTFFPADGQFPATILAAYLPAIADADMILGVLPRRNDGQLARLLSFGERALLRLLFGRFPRFQGILMFRTELLRGTPLVSQGRGWTVLMEFILRKARAGARIKNVPITLRPRGSGVSKVNNLRSIVSNLRQVLALRLSL